MLVNVKILRVRAKDRKVSLIPRAKTMNFTEICVLICLCQKYFVILCAEIKMNNGR